MEKRIKIKQLGSFYNSFGGRNNLGRITIRGRGAGNKNLRLLIDANRRVEGLVGKIVKIQRDNKRTGYIGLLRYSNGYLSYILVSEYNRVGDYIMNAISGKTLYKNIISIGSVFMLKFMKEGSIFFNLERKSNFGGIIGKAAGSEIKLLKKYSNVNKCLLKLPSGSYSIFPDKCRVVSGFVSNKENRDIFLYKAGQNRWFGIKPRVRGEAMNPVDHPHGGRTKGGRIPVSAWGKLAKGLKTRDKKKKRLSL
jgi:large subunit ribosomal protein L2